MKVLVIIICYYSIVLAQCSDAGVCSVGDHSANINTAEAGIHYYFGSSGKEDEVTFNSVLLSAEYKITETTGLYASIPYSFQNGPLGEVSGIGDLLVLLKQQVFEQNDLQVELQAGGKLAAGDDNQSDLPQIYQSGLGSNDILAGVMIGYYDFNFGVAYQLAGKRNSNILQLKRGDDLLLRGGYSFSIDESSIAIVEVLSITRLQKSSIISADGSTFVDVPESNETQINITGNFIYAVSESVDISFFGAVPLRNRPDNTDGLKRSLTLSAGVKYKF